MTTVQELQKEFLPTIAPEDFFLLISHATNKEKVFLLVHPEYVLTKEQEEKATHSFKRRLKHEPVAYITGHKEFYGREFLVNHATLIPRPETELMIETILQEMTKLSTPTPIDIIDLGTGSGNIIVTLACELPALFPTLNFHFTAADISSHALLQAQKNAKQYHATPLITFLKSDLLKNIPTPQEEKNHCIIAANLPYLSTEIYQNSAPDVRDHEPQIALESGSLGLDHYMRLLEQLHLFLPSFSSVTVFLEISPEQAMFIKAIIAEQFPQSSTTILHDFSGRARLIRFSL